MSTVYTNQEIAGHIRDNARRLLHSRSWSQRRLAKETGDPHMSIVNALSGNHVPNAGILSRIADALGATVDSLLAPPPKPKKNSRKSA